MVIDASKAVEVDCSSGMKISFEDEELDAMETDPNYRGPVSQSVVKAYRKRVAQIRAALDERDLYAIKSLHFEKLKGQRKNQHSLRLNNQYRLILEMEGQSDDKVVKIIRIEDYHR